MPTKETPGARVTLPGSPDLPGYDDVVETGRDSGSVVFSARHGASGRVVRVRVMSGAALGSAARDRYEQVQRRLMGVTARPGLLTVLDTGSTKTGDLFVVTESPDGVALSRLLEDGAPQIEEAVERAASLADAATALHDVGLVHGRIDPGNVFLTTAGTVALGDTAAPGAQGLPEVDDDPDRVLAHTAPEVVRGDPRTKRSDVYSLGAVLFSLLRGAAPFSDGDGGPLAAVARAGLDPPANLRLFGVPDGICVAVERAMAKDPPARPADAPAFLRDLRGEPAPDAPPPLDAAPPETVAGVPPMAEVARPPPALSPPARRQGPNRGRLVALTAVVAVVLAAAAFLAVRALTPPDEVGAVAKEKTATGPAKEPAERAEGAGSDRQATAAPASGFTTVADETGTFQAQVPAAWTGIFKRTDAGTTRVLKAAPAMGKFLDFAGPGVVFKVTDFQEGSEDARDRLGHVERESMVEGAGCQTALIFVPDEVPGQEDALGEEWRGCPGGGREMDYAYTANVDGRKYVVGISARVFSEADEAAFEEMVKSVKIG